MIYLDREHLQALRREAAARGISMTELVRRLISRHLEGHLPPPPVPREVYLKLVGLGASGRDDISERHDAYPGDAIRRKHAR